MHQGDRDRARHPPVKDFIRDLCPPRLWRAFAAMRPRSAVPRKMFGGVFRRFDEVADQRPWAQPGYYETCRAQLKECPAIHPTAQTTHALLALLINALPAGRAPRILDFGGGTGLRFWSTRPALNQPVAWQVVDSPALASISSEVMGAATELAFAASLPPAGSAFDLVLVYSSLQYVEAQDELLVTLASYRPRYIVLPRLMALGDQSYVTRQLVQGFTTPCKVSSIDEITSTLARWRYERVLMVRDGFDLSPMCDEDVPITMRTGKEWLLVFRSVS